jgi:DUF1680 family protein
MLSRHSFPHLLRVSGNVARLGLRKSNPWYLWVSFEDRFGHTHKIESSRTHLDATIAWICRAQDCYSHGGVAAGYSFIEGWLHPYPETTGYIIPTFYDYADLTGREEYRTRARRMADWEVEIQLPGGGVQGGHFFGMDRDRPPVVFNTGQVILGWTRAFRETEDERYLIAACRAGDWLISVQSPDGAWRHDGPVVETNVHAYDARTAWSLLEIEALTDDGRYAEAAHRNLGWTLAQQRANGWFDNNSFSPDVPPPTHSIAYVMEGMVESERLTGRSDYLNAALETATRLATIFESRDFMPGEFDGDWETRADYSCLTGNVQIAGVWLQLYRKTGIERFLNGAVKLNNYVKSTQNLKTRHPGICGGVKGSHPISGFYMQYSYPNWAAKFLADSLMLEESLRGGGKEAEAESPVHQGVH